MAGILDGVDQRTRLVGENRLELLLFNLGGRQRFGINVFKVQEVIKCPPLTKMVSANRMVRGITNIRGQTISVIDLAAAIGKKPLPASPDNYLIVAEYNRSIQGFVVGGVDRIVNINWECIKAPPKGLGKDSYLTAVTDIDDELVEIIDVEKVLAEMMGANVVVDAAEQLQGRQADALRILVADDSSVARNQVKHTLDQLGMESVLVKNGREGMAYLLGMLAEDANTDRRIDAVISDVEMPEMDGYTLTAEIRKHSGLKELPVLLHSSLSGVFNGNMVEKVGADAFVAKFQANELAREVEKLLVSKGLLA